MRDRVLMSPNNGQLVLGIPLYQRSAVENMYGNQVIICVEADRPTAYAIDCGPEFDRIQLFDAEWVERNLIDLGEL